MQLYHGNLVDAVRQLVIFYSCQSQVKRRDLSPTILKSQELEVIIHKS